MFKEIKPKNARSARALKHRAPRIVENAKIALFLKSTSCSSLLNAVVTDLHSLKRPLALRFTKKNAIYPFEDASSLEFFSEKNDTSLLCFSSHSKKRPHNLTFVRTFDSKILDMMECLIDPGTLRLMSQFGGAKARVGTKPLLCFSSPLFDDESEFAVKFRLAKSFFLDFFRGEESSQVDVEGLQTIISFAASDLELTRSERKQVVHMRVWRIITKRSGHKIPRIELEETGPRVDFQMGRIREADETILKESLKQSRQQDAKTRKNIETDLLGDKIGRIHMLKQDFDELQTRKMKGLKRGHEHMSDANEDDVLDSSENSGSNDYVDEMYSASLASESKESQSEEEVEEAGTLQDLSNQSQVQKKRRVL